MAVDRVRLIHDWLEAARPTAAKIGCSPAAIVAQAVLESAWGQSAIGCNLFGIKADAGWQGARKLVTTREFIDGQWITIQDWFRDYPSLADSFADHFRFLEQNSRYRAAGVFDARSDREYFEALHRAGYATAPNYAEQLMEVEASVQTLAGIPTAPRSVLMKGDRGSDVKAMQVALGELGFHCTADGIFGNDTLATVRAFQRARGLSIDGIVGPQTKAALGLKEQ